MTPFLGCSVLSAEEAPIGLAARSNQRIISVSVVLWYARMVLLPSPPLTWSRGVLAVAVLSDLGRELGLEHFGGIRAGVAADDFFRRGMRLVLRTPVSLAVARLRGVARNVARTRSDWC